MVDGRLACSILLFCSLSQSMQLPLAPQVLRDFSIDTARCDTCTTCLDPGSWVCYPKYQRDECDAALGLKWCGENVKITIKTDVNNTRSTPDVVSEKQMSGLRQAFDHVDLNESGGISLEELRLAINATGVAVGAAELRDIFAQMDTDKSGMVDFDEFAKYIARTWFWMEAPPQGGCKALVNLAETYLQASRKSAALHKSFNSMASEQTGKIELPSFKTFFIGQGIEVSETMVTTLFKELDTDEDGKITFDEYAKFINRAFIEKKLKGKTKYAAMVLISAARSFIAKQGVDSANTDARMEGLKDVFEAIDKDRDGALVFDELKETIVATGFEMTKKEETQLRSAFDDMDEDKDGKVVLEEFARYISKLMSKEMPDAKYTKATEALVELVQKYITIPPEDIGSRRL